MSDHSNKPEHPIKSWIYALIALAVIFAGGGAGLSQFGTEVSDNGTGHTGAVLETSKSEVPAGKQYVFRNERLLQEHYEKHGIEMGFASAQAYQEAASNAASNPAALHKLEAEDGDDVYYLEESNEFVIVSTDGYLRTYFNPDRGKDYFDRQ